MNYSRFFPPGVHQTLAYEPPGAWMPPLAPGVIRLNAGYPFPASVPIQALAQAAGDLAAAEGDLPFQYWGSPSMARLANLLAERSAARGIAVPENGLMVTAGAAQALDLAARALLGPGDLVAVEAPTYMEALEMFRNYTDHIFGYPVDQDGLQVEALAADLARRQREGLPLPKLLYTIASFQNPTGATLAPARRRRLLELAEAFDFLILEDDAYGELSFGPQPVPLKAMDQVGRVIYVGSLSKIVAPGIRIGWVVAAPELVAAMRLFKKDLDHPLGWGIAAQYLTGVDLGGRVADLCAAYRHRRDLMLKSLRREMPAGVSWTEPGGGFFIWVRVPGMDTVELLPRALAAGVAYVPGKYFYFGETGQGRDCLRLSFSYLSPEDLQRGVALLASVLRA